MVEYQHAQLIRGRYQLVALTHSPEYSPADVFGYAVATSEGARLTEDLSLEQARSRLQAPAGTGPGGGSQGRCR